MILENLITQGSLLALVLAAYIHPLNMSVVSTLRALKSYEEDDRQYGDWIHFYQRKWVRWALNFFVLMGIPMMLWPPIYVGLYEGVWLGLLAYVFMHFAGYLMELGRMRLCAKFWPGRDIHHDPLLGGIYIVSCVVAVFAILYLTREKLPIDGIIWFFTTFGYFLIWLALFCWVLIVLGVILLGLFGEQKPGKHKSSLREAIEVTLIFFYPVYIFIPFAIFDWEFWGYTGKEALTNVAVVVTFAYMPLLTLGIGRQRKRKRED